MARTNRSFPNSDGWKVKKPRLIQRVEPCAALPDEQDEGDDHRGADEDGAPVAPVEIRVDERRSHEHDRPHARVEDLAVEVVARIARHRELRDARDAPEPDGDERRDADEQDPVDRADDAEQARRLALCAQPCPL